MAYSSGGFFVLKVTFGEFGAEVQPANDNAINPAGNTKRRIEFFLKPFEDKTVAPQGVRRGTNYIGIFPEPLNMSPNLMMGFPQIMKLRRHDDVRGAS